MTHRAHDHKRKTTSELADHGACLRGTGDPQPCHRARIRFSSDFARQRLDRVRSRRMHPTAPAVVELGFDPPRDGPRELRVPPHLVLTRAMRRIAWRNRRSPARSACIFATAAPNVSRTQPSTAFSIAMPSSVRIRGSVVRTSGTSPPSLSARAVTSRACRTSSLAARRAARESVFGAPWASSSRARCRKACTEAASRCAISASVRAAEVGPHAHSQGTSPSGRRPVPIPQRKSSQATRGGSPMNGGSIAHAIADASPSSGQSATHREGGSVPASSAPHD